MRLLKLAAGIVGSALLLSSCVTRADIRGIQTDLYTIQTGLETRLGNVKNQTDTVQTTQADLLQGMKELTDSMNALRTELQDNSQRMGRLSGRLDDLESSLIARMDSQIELLSGSKFVEKPSPSTVFNLANTDFVRGRYPEAIRGFESYIKQFPRGEKVPESRLKIGDALSRQKDWTGAIKAYDEFIQNYPKDAQYTTALLRKGLALESAGRKSAAQEIYSTLIKNYPLSAEAKSAQDQLRALQNPGSNQ